MPLLTLDYQLVNLTTEGEWVKVKCHLTRRDRNHIKAAAINLRVDIDPVTQQPVMPEGVDVDTAAMLNSLDFAILERAIVGWSYDEPVTPGTIERMQDEDIDLLKDFLGKLYEPKSAEAKN